MAGLPETEERQIKQHRGREDAHPGASQLHRGHHEHQRRDNPGRSHKDCLHRIEQDPNPARHAVKQPPVEGFHVVDSLVNVLGKPMVQIDRARAGGLLDNDAPGSVIVAWEGVLRRTLEARRGLGTRRWSSRSNRSFRGTCRPS